MRARDLVALGLWSYNDLLQFVDGSTHTIDPDELFYPVSTCWPQGISWSSSVAQECTLSICRNAGIDEATIMCLEEALPASHDQLAAVCTDAIILFNKFQHDGVERTRAIDAAIQSNGLVRNVAKDVNQALEMSGLG